MYKKFKVFKQITGPAENDFRWIVEGKERGWFKPWKLLGVFTTEADGRQAVKRLATYPYTSNVFWFFGDGTEDNVW